MVGRPSIQHTHTHIYFFLLPHHETFSFNLVMDHRDMLGSDYHVESVPIHSAGCVGSDGYCLHRKLTPGPLLISPYFVWNASTYSFLPTYT